MLEAQRLSVLEFLQVLRPVTERLKNALVSEKNAEIHQVLDV